MQGIADCQPSQFKCGALECIAIGNRKLYWSCGENCLRTSEQCQGTCPKGFSACGSSECWENHYFERYTHTVLWLLLRKLCLVNLPTPLKKAVLVLWRKMYQYLWEMQWNMPNRLLSLRVKPMQRGQQRVSIMWGKMYQQLQAMQRYMPRRILCLWVKWMLERHWILSKRIPYLWGQMYSKVKTMQWDMSWRILRLWS